MVFYNIQLLNCVYHELHQKNMTSGCRMSANHCRYQSRSVWLLFQNRALVWQIWGRLVLYNPFLLIFISLTAVYDIFIHEYNTLFDRLPAKRGLCGLNQAFCKCPCLVRLAFFIRKFVFLGLRILTFQRRKDCPKRLFWLLSVKFLIIYPTLCPFYSQKF